MKKSHLTLAILTAVLVSACGGSSSNDDATKDHGKPITPSKTTPTTPTKTTPTTPTTNDNSAKKPSTPTASTTPSDSTPSTPTKTTTPTPTKTTPTTTLTPEQKTVLAETKKRDEAEKKIEEKLQPKLNEAKNKEQELETKLKDEKNQLSAEEKQKLEDQIVAAKLEALEKYNDVLEEGKKIAESNLKIAQNSGHDPVQFEKDVAEANASLELQAASKAYAEAQQAQTLANRASSERTKLVSQYSEALKTLKNTDEATKNLINQFGNAVDKLQRLSGNKDNPNQEEIAQQKEKIKEAMDKLGENNENLKTLGEKIVKADEEAEKLQEAAKKLDLAKTEKDFNEKQAALSALESFNGVRFSDAQNDTFGEVRSVSYDNGKWLITFTEAEGAKDDKVEVAKSSDDSAKYGTLTAAVEGNKTPAQGVKATAYSAYGYVGDKFFSVGKLISLKDYVSKAIKAAGADGKEAPKELKLKYQGTAFVKANDKNQVAYFEATANFDDKPTLNGSFSHFQTYTDTLPKDTPTEKADDKVKFESTINPENSSFATTDNKADVKVQGFFYQATENKSGLGGLVDSKKEGHVFKGAFGGEQVTQPATTQPTTTQPTTTQPTTTQPATTQTAGQ